MKLNIKINFPIFLFLLLMVMTFLISPVEARFNNNLIITTKQGNCVQNPEDPFEEGWIVPEGAASPYRGQCIDVSTKRPARILEISQQVVRFANFQYQGAFYVLEVERQSIIKAIYQTENFTPVGPIQPAHTQIRFVVDPSRPAKIFYQYGPHLGQQAGELNDFVMSADYMAPEGVEYSPIEGFNVFGLRGHYMNVIRFISTQDRYDRSVVMFGHEVKQYELELSSEQMDRLFIIGVKESQGRDINEVYDVLWLNCTTESFRIIAQAIGHPSLRWTPSLRYTFDPVAARAIDLLDAARLIRAELASLNEEWPQR